MVVDSRPAKESNYDDMPVNSIRRRRRCEVCGLKFTTYETILARDVEAQRPNSVFQAAHDIIDGRRPASPWGGLSWE